DGIRDYKVTGVQTCALPICWSLLSHYERRKREAELHATLPLVRYAWAGAVVMCLIARATRSVAQESPASNRTVTTMPEGRYKARSEERRVGKECRRRWGS